MSRDITIETINVGHPDSQGDEFVALANTSTKRIHLNGWKLVWTELPKGRELHSDVFEFEKDNFFDPGEKIFLFSGVGNGGFRRERKNPYCPIAHWLMYTGSIKHICSVPHVKVTLYDANGIEVDHRYSMQGRHDKNTCPAIVIGHGGNLAWRDLKDFLQDQCRFEVEAFETYPQASRTIPEIIVALGDKSNMAVLVLTGEDETADGEIRARQNLIHELGKFQERFGDNKTIILLERGVELPSNLSGIVYLEFESGNIKAIFGDIMTTINREFKLW